LRGLTPNSLAAFDFAEQGMVTGARDTTTVAPQALYLLNDPFERAQSQALAQRLLRPPEKSDAQRIDLAYRLALGRIARPAEVARAGEYLTEYAAAAKESLGTSRVVVGKAPPSKPNRSKSQKLAIRKVSQSVTRSLKSDVRQRAVDEETVAQPLDPKTAAWASFCQALFSSAEFRYVR
jgi:hypothetical protein